MSSILLNPHYTVPSFTPLHKLNLSYFGCKSQRKYRGDDLELWVLGGRQFCDALDGDIG